MRCVELLWLAIALLGAAPAVPEPCAITLVDVAADAGLDFRHRRGARGAKQLPETMGSGVAWLDFDGDGWLDLYAVQSGPLPGDAPPGDPARANRLFRNLGGASSPRFVEIPAAAGAGDRGYGQGVVAGDADGDGTVDLYVANFGPDALYVNRGDGTFEERTAAAGLGLDGWSSSAAFADYDRDGDLDLYVTRYLIYDLGHDLFCGDLDAGERDYCAPWLFAGASDRLYRNRGDGTFDDVTAAAGLAGADGKGLGVIFADLDGDRWPDLYVANDQTVNSLFRNRGDGTFEDLSFLSGAGVNQEGLPEAGMGLAVGDVDGDGRPDLAVTNYDVETNTLYKNLGGMQFADVSVPSGFGLPSFNLLGFGLALADFDRDGDLDAYVANGHVREHTRRQSVAYAQPDLVLLNDAGPDRRFVPLPCAVPPAPHHVGRGLAWADFDRDGDPDLAISNSGGPLQLLRNDGAGGGWLGLGLRPAAAAVGALVRLRSAAGEQSRLILAGDAYQSTSAPEALFGFRSPPTTLSVTWPDGRRVLLRHPPTGVRLLFRAAGPKRAEAADPQPP
ncbi:MAG: CRTAC1 family protein [Acidobacteria bacterium]|nr:MAG: CRTAC1 family protein [Acidobacteriota bacterium]